MLQFHRGYGAVSCASQDGEGDEGMVASLDLGPRRHCLEDVLDLFHGRRSLLSLGRRNPRVLVGQVEILSVGILNARLVAGLPRKPLEETFELRQSGVQSCLA
jgi:hypothetical protein